MMGQHLTLWLVVSAAVFAALASSQTLSNVALARNGARCRASSVWRNHERLNCWKAIDGLTLHSNHEWAANGRGLAEEWLEITFLTMFRLDSTRLMQRYNRNDQIEVIDLIFDWGQTIRLGLEAGEGSSHTSVGAANWQEFPLPSVCSSSVRIEIVEMYPWVPNTVPGFQEVEFIASGLCTTRNVARAAYGTTCTSIEGRSCEKAIDGMAIHGSDWAWTALGPGTDVWIEFQLPSLYELVFARIMQSAMYVAQFKDVGITFDGGASTNVTLIRRNGTRSYDQSGILFDEFWIPPVCTRSARLDTLSVYANGGDGNYGYMEIEFYASDNSCWDRVGFSASAGHVAKMVVDI